jgi:RNA polymerase sigma-70 factor, ECF subfamily
LASTDRQARRTVPADSDALDSRRAAFETLFNANYAGVFGVLYRLLGDSDQAQDLAQETFWRLWRRPPHEAGSLGGWLYRVALRLGYNALRASRRRQNYEMAAGVDALQRTAPPNPSAMVELRETRLRVRQVLAEMTPRSAQLLVLRYSGMSYREVADAMGLSPTSIGTLLRRAEEEFECLYVDGNGEQGG